MTTLWLALIALASAQAITFITQRKLIMTVQASLKNLVEFNGNNLRTLSEAVGQIPQRITQVVQKAIADYLAEHPDESVGSVPDDVLLDAIQQITDQSKDMLVNAASIPVWFDNQIANGTPEVLKAPEQVQADLDAEAATSTGEA